MTSLILKESLGNYFYLFWEKIGLLGICGIWWNQYKDTDWALCSSFHELFLLCFNSLPSSYSKIYFQNTWHRKHASYFLFPKQSLILFPEHTEMYTYCSKDTAMKNWYVVMWESYYDIYDKVTLIMTLSSFSVLLHTIQISWWGFCFFWAFVSICETCKAQLILSLEKWKKKYCLYFHQ